MTRRYDPALFAHGIGWTDTHGLCDVPCLGAGALSVGPLCMYIARVLAYTNAAMTNSRSAGAGFDPPLLHREQL